MALKDFFHKDSNSHACEELFNHKLLFDIKLAAAKAGYHLRNYYSDVDHDGFDLIIDDNVNVRKIQLKSVRRDSTTAEWQIHRGLLRPTANNLEALGFQYQSEQFSGGKIAWGAEGGVVVIEYEITAQETVSVSYSYTDVYVISAIALGVLKRTAATVRAAVRVREQLPTGGATEKVNLVKGLFMRCAGPSNLLALAGVMSEFAQNWQVRVRSLASEEWGPKGGVLADQLAQYRLELPQILKSVSGEPD